MANQIRASIPTLGDFRKHTANLPDDTPLFAGALDYYYRQTKHDTKREGKVELPADGYLKLADFILYDPQQNRNET